jgi:sulfide dehydrogenase cytochrome subunit
MNAAFVAIATIALISLWTVADAQQPPRPREPAEKYGTPVAVAPPVEPPAGASSCSGCHPATAAVITPVARLAGRDPAEIVAAMQAFRSGQRPATVMDRIAKGFTDDEAKAIADWYGAQKD